MQKIEEIKKEYNYWINRYLKAETFINSVPEETSKKYMDHFYNIVQELSKLMQEYRKEMGFNMSNYEMFNGFK